VHTAAGDCRKNCQWEVPQLTGNTEEPTISPDSTEELVRIGSHPPVLRLAFAVGVLVLGGFGMWGLGQLYRAPETAEPPSPVLRATAMRMEPQDFQTTLRGFGTARSRVRLDIRPEVAGRVETLHPRLDAGLVVPRGDVLFTIEKSDYEARLAEAEAEVLRLQAEQEKLRRERENDQRRMEVAKQQLVLAQREYDRIAKLFEEGGTESQARLDQARISLLQREDAVVTIENNLALYDSRLMANDAQQRTAIARRDTASKDLERTTVVAPFDGRIAMRDLEVGKFVSAGQTVLTLANDEDIEIPVSLESSEVSRWLDVAINPTNLHWFGDFADAAVRVRWVEQPQGSLHSGRLHRVQSYNPETRTFEFVIRVDPGSSSDSSADAPFFPLTDGMFCIVEIPGRVAHDVYVVPRQAVDSRGDVLAVRDGRLVSLPVQVIRKQDDVALIASGLEPGEIVILSRPPSTLDGTRVEPILVSSEQQEDRAL
jgi:RND family efflux transporter MFP subunit